MAKNIGEYDEMRLKLHLIELRDTKTPIIIKNQQTLIHSVKNAGVECAPLPDHTTLSQMTDLQIEDLAKRVGAFKATAGSKADVYLNGKGLSIKSHRGANPAFLNHTHRAGILKVCERIGMCIDLLDKIIDTYWEKRSAGIIGEDIKNGDPHSPFFSYQDYLQPLINYFLFTGTAQKDSTYPADYILDFSHPLKEATWSFYQEDYLNQHWKNIVFSIRSKGIPSSYPHGSNSALIAPWVRFYDGQHKGSLHARIQL